MRNNNDFVVINLDRPRVLKFGHKALKTLTAMTGKDIETVVSAENFDLGEIEKIMYCGLLSDAKSNNETLILDDMEDLLDQADSFEEIVCKMEEALNKSFGNLGQEIPTKK